MCENDVEGVLIVTHVTHVERVESGVCGLCTQYRYIQYYVEMVERSLNSSDSYSCYSCRKWCLWLMYTIQIHSMLCQKGQKIMNCKARKPVVCTFLFDDTLPCFSLSPPDVVVTSDGTEFLNVTAYAFCFGGFFGVFFFWC